MRISHFIFICINLFFTNIYSQNAIGLVPSSNLTSTSFDVEVTLTNEDIIKGLQFDISYSPDAFQLETGHSLTNRAANFVLGVSSPAAGISRVIIYSTTNAKIALGDGQLVTLKFKTKSLPGTFPVILQNIVASDSDGTSLDVLGSSQNIEVKGPILTILTPSIFFGDVPLLSAPTRNLTIQNSGNSPLTISGLASAEAPFGVEETFPITIPPNETTDLTITVNTSTKIQTTVPLQFTNDDPDPIRKLQKSDVQVRVFAVNEIYLGSGSGTINSPIEIPVTFSNMEPFSGFQFDVVLPDGFIFVANSIVKSGRFDDHVISSSIINTNTLRFIAYSSSNSFFKGIDGEVFKFSVVPNVSSGTYTLPISNAIISNPTLGNIISDSFNGTVQINSPNLEINPIFINYGDVPIIETKKSAIVLTNSGSSELILNEISHDAAELTFNAFLPLSILPGNNKTIQMTMVPKQIGVLSKNISFKYNGPDYQKVLQVQATIYSPNFISLKSQTGFKNQENSFQILLKNNDAVRAIQFDVEFPAGFTLKTNNIATTTRTSGFNISTSLLSDNKYRILIYNLSNDSISPGDDSIVSLPMFLAETLSLGEYQFNFSNIILSNTANQNSATPAIENGIITIESSLAVNSFDNKLEVLIFPNPTGSLVNIKAPDKLQIKSIEIYSSVGQKLSTYYKNKFSVEHLQSGTYFLKIESSQGVIVKKVIKNN